METTIDVELIGSYGAMCADASVSLSSRKHPKDPLGPLARLLIERGWDPDTRMHVVRGGHPVFKRDRKLSAWAGEDWGDTELRPAHRRKWHPFVYRSGQTLASGTSDE